ncbi:hypothetical protein HPB48_022582 [Haemaphysalis longicornis]|uniref:Uncharacterized protein n=1 Tax=Haemaphysalis longicornis TaxID=44386 RepID=A0A9J6GVD2_HAELO|nr:hypothetical protein HPB48_022582 [Haemaphysalis longicornis]
MPCSRQQKRAITANMTLYFKTMLKTRVVLGCTEIDIEKVKDFKSRLSTYKPYQNTYMAKCW